MARLSNWRVRMCSVRDFSVRTYGIEWDGTHQTWILQGGVPKIAKLVYYSLITRTYGRYIYS